MSKARKKQAVKVLVSDPIHREALSHLEHKGFTITERLGLAGDELVSALIDHDVLICRTGTKLPTSVLEKSKNLKCIALASTGYDQIDIETAGAHGVAVIGLPSENKNIDPYQHGNFISAAEHTILLILNALGDTHNAAYSMKNKRWEKDNFLGREAYQKTLGIIGLGRIGKLVAKRAQGLEMEVIAYDPHISESEMTGYSVRKVSLDELCQTADVISIHTHKTPETVNLIDKSKFKLMKFGTILINTSRSEIVNKDDLLEALNNGVIHRYSVDVFRNEPHDIEWDLVEHIQVIPTPHIGGSTEEALRRISMSTVNSLIEYLGEAKTDNVINKKFLK